ncbi:hypothetical protein MKW98_012948 [Papaver atlanticum]|uniref:Uncharacterized protein n=1 Tax=Papaver atlanticum TaxID=357466 RepID=A0AAD4XFM6_9MAGN|nr:hypothetical protein MKW98_012948 [Papaver atlanticum]
MKITSFSTSRSSYYSFNVFAKTKNPDSSSSKEPPRITSNIKQNLQFLKLWKEYQSNKSRAPKPATKYRKKKVDKDDLFGDEELYRDPTMNLYYTHQGLDLETVVPVLLVDGYNYVERVDLVFSSESCADAWIEKEVAALREDGCPKVWVVTSDHCQQHAAHGAGAFIWSCKALISEIKSSQKEYDRMLDEQRSSSMQGKLLKHNLEPEVVDALKDLKKKLSENESK